VTRPTLSVQAAIGPGTVTGQFIIGTSLLGGTDVLANSTIVGVGTWVELADRCYRVTTRRGRQRQLEQYRAGTLTALFDNSDGTLNPAWNAGPNSNAGVSLIRPMAPMKVKATWSGVDYDLIYAYADNWLPVYHYPESGEITYTGTDAFKILTVINPVAQAAVGAGDTTGARLGRILNAGGWPSALRDLDAGQSTHQSTTLAQPIATQARLAADSERGDLYISPSNMVTHRGRQTRYTAARSVTPQWIIGDGVGEYNPSAFTTSDDDRLQRNYVAVSRAGGNVITRQDSISLAYPYLARSYNRTDLTLADDNQVADYCDTVLRQFATQLPRVDTVMFQPDGYDDLWPLVLGVKFGDRVSVNLTDPGTGFRWLGDYFVEGVDHDIPAVERGPWQTVLYLSDASKFPRHPFIIGSSLLGGTDVLVP